MKYRTSRTNRKRTSSLLKVSRVLTKLQPHFINSVNQTPVFSPDQRKRMIDRYGQISEEVLDGITREKGVVSVREDVVPDRQVFREEDISLQVKFESLEEEVQYFVSMGLNVLEKLFLTGNMSDTTYLKYRRLLRYIPKLHTDLVSMFERSRRE